MRHFRRLDVKLPAHASDASLPIQGATATDTTALSARVEVLPVARLTDGGLLSKLPPMSR